MALRSGSKLGPYVALAALGAGDMGAVYCARDEKPGRYVALALLPEKFPANPECVIPFGCRSLRW